MKIDIMWGEWTVVKERNDKNDESCLRLSNQGTLSGVVGVCDGS